MVFILKTITILTKIDQNDNILPAWLEKNVIHTDNSQQSWKTSPRWLQRVLVLSHP